MNVSLTTMDITIILIIMGLYILGMVLIGIFMSKYNKNTSEFFLGGRTIGPWLASISSTASSESGWLVLGSVGLVYTQGLSAWWFMPGCLIGYLINWMFLAKHLQSHSQKKKSITVADYIADVIGDRHNILRSIVVFIVFLSLMVYVASQFAASGKDVGAVFSLDVHEQFPVVLFASFVIIGYTLLGGFRAVVWTDFIQGVMMVISMIIMPIIAFFLIMQHVDWSLAYDRLIQDVPHFFSFTGKEAGFAVVGGILGLLGIGLGYPGQPHVINRYMSAKDNQTIRRGRMIALGWGFFAYGGAIALGILGHLLIPGLSEDQSEMLLPLLAVKFLHPIIAGLIIAAVMAAIMSTASAQLLVASSAIARDIFEQSLKHPFTHKQLVIISRITVLVLGVLALIFALLYKDLVFWMVLFAWSGLGAAFGPIILLSLSKFKIHFWGAVSGMITGFITTLFWKISGLSEVIYELVPAFIFALAVCIFVSLAANSLDSKNNTGGRRIS